MKGDQLQVHRDTLAELLATTAHNLIVMVTIERTHDKHRHPYRFAGNDDELPYLEPSFNVYLIDESGRSQHL